LINLKEEITGGEILTEIEIKNRMFKIIAPLLALVLFVSCDSNIVISKNKSLSGSWNKNEVIHFNIPQLDSIKTYNIFINLRNTNDYKYSNIFLIVSMQFPHGKTITDTLEYKMANPDGSWLGKGIGNVKENKLWYKEQISFLEKGDYNLSITQAVRNNGNVEGVTNLEGITDVGFSIEEIPQE